MLDTPMKVLLSTDKEIMRLQKLNNSTTRQDKRHVEDLILSEKYCANMRPIISRSLFVQFTAMGLVLACTLIQILFFANFLTALSAIWYLAAAALQSFPICFTCDHILADCQKLSMAIFHSNWIGADHRYTSALRHFMHNAQQPIRFMGGGVLPICLATYSQMVKMATKHLSRK
ncbi:odorant receptor 98a-like [Drosophila albomicans]|uniref:Odorant receptor 98a-like n=1 Tax=Drosophila albomicans TaxID=7291 RepID=A0A9C6WHN5_DROAB|nr:odorant receptor 98a-like [Drosophila albomicans]